MESFQTILAGAVWGSQADANRDSSHEVLGERYGDFAPGVSWTFKQTDLTLWEKRVSLSFKAEVAFVKMPPPSVPNLLMSDRRFNWSLRHERFYCTLLLSVSSDETIRFSTFAALS